LLQLSTFRTRKWINQDDSLEKQAQATV
jgi:hypothetical protein